MALFISKTVIVDTNFWFALFDKSDERHSDADRIMKEINKSKILIPWPTLYEILNTKFMDKSNLIALTNFEKIIKNQNIELLDDNKYRDIALFESFETSKNKKWDLSLVDTIIRHILVDLNLKKDYLLTFNEKDFIDILKKRKSIELIY